MVEKVIDNNAIKVAIKPSRGIPEPTSIPSTKAVSYTHLRAHETN